jgi:hypothetical protein
MLDTHGLDLGETYGDSEVSDELSKLRPLLGDNINLELGKHCCSCLSCHNSHCALSITDGTQLGLSNAGAFGQDS